KNYAFMLDTGYTGALTVTPDIYDSLLSSGFLEDGHETSVSNISGKFTSRKGFLKLLLFAGVQFKSVPVLASSKNKIGVEMLSRFNWVINHNRVYCVEQSKNSNGEIKW
ncbi:MAG: hypothetical protein ACF8CQ_08565, partial [Rhodopirellula sp. JB044]